MEIFKPLPGRTPPDKDQDGDPQEFTLKVWSKDEVEILAVKTLLGVNATAAKEEADRVIGMLQG